MRISVLVSGEPRFCSEFNKIIENLKDYNVDWYFTLWSNCDSKNGIGKGYISENWRNINYDFAYNKIQSNLPPAHKIIHLEIIDQTSIHFENITHRLGWGAKSEYSHKMTYGWFLTCLAKKKYEDENSFNYNIVIKGRPDAGIDVNLELIKELLEGQRHVIFPGAGMPSGTSYRNKFITDILFVSSSKIMDDICNFYNTAKIHFDKGTDWNIEQLLICHLEDLNITTSRNESLYLHFRMAKDHVGGWNPNLWTPNFDNWN